MAIYSGDKLISTYLIHHGILGQRWGIRRFQNPDGSLTKAGKRRYAKETMSALKDPRKREQVGYPLSTAAVGYVGYNSEKNGYTTKESKIAYYEQARRAMEIGELSVKTTFEAHYNDGVVIAKVANVPLAVLTLDKKGDITTTFPPDVLEAQADFLDYVNNYYQSNGN